MDGLLIVDKEKGYTSRDIVNIIGKKFNTKKVGHTGTLDPNATGVLPLLIGKATLISKYLINHDKRYIATLKLGLKTDTADGEGNIIEQHILDNNIMSDDIIKGVFNKLIGKQEQIPPVYSAIKVNGRKLYEYARAGEEVNIEPRLIEIYDLKLLSINIEEKEIKFGVSCSKGTYIRSLCEKVAELLGTIGYMKELERVEVGQFNIEKAIDLKVLEENKEDELFLEEKLISIEKIFEEREAINLRDKRLALFLNGVKLSIVKPNSIYRIYNQNKFIGLGTINNNELKRDVII